MEENLNKSLQNKGYVCNYKCVCRLHQIKNLGIKEESVPNLKDEKRVGIIKRLTVIKREIENKKKSIEVVETEVTVLEKCWYESWGLAEELVVILEKSEKVINNVKEIENNLDNIIKFVHGKDKELNEYRKKVIFVGIKSLFELEKITYWDKYVYFLYNVNSTGKSSGVSLLIAFYSAFFKIGVSSNFSATGEINIENGNVKGIRGLKEKFICVLLNKEIDNLILPQENYEEVLRISDAYSKRFVKSKKLKFHSVNRWKDLVDLLFQ